MPINDADMLIKVKEKEHAAILDRDTVTTDAKKHLTPWLELMRDLVNYGTNLIVRCIHSSERKTKDRVVLSILLRQAVAMLDAVEVLLSNGSSHAANLPMRALFEASTYIEWILLSDSELKARYYHVHNLRRKRLWAGRTQAGSPEKAAFASQMGKYGMNITDEVEQRSRDQIKEIDRILALPELAMINADFDAAKAKRRLKYDVAWYIPLGPRNLAAIAHEIDDVALYVILYSGASEVMHSSSDDPHVQFAAGKLSIKPIRSLADFPTVFQFSVSIALRLYRRILQEYRSGEISAFSRKYVEQWQKQYMNFLKIRYEVQDVITL